MNPMKRSIVIGAIVVVLVAAIGLAVQRALTKPPDVPALKLITSVDRGIDAVHKKQIEDKISEIKTKIGDRHDIKDIELWLGLGTYQNLLGDLAAARATFETTLTLNQLNYVAWGDLADTLAEMHDLPGAERAYRKAIDESNGLESFYTKYASFLHDHYRARTKDYENLLLEAVHADGQTPGLIESLAQFYEDEGRLAEAKSHFELLVQLAPDNVGAKQDLARVTQELLKQQAGQ